MLFNSLHFFIFFPIVFFVYFTIPPRFRWFWLLLASSYFYMVFIPQYILILYFIIIVDYFAGRMIEKSTGRRRKVYLMASIIANIGVLFLFKYFNFFTSNLTGLAHFLHWNYTPSVFRLLLPIGLSFHTFQALSYTIEVYRGRQPAERHLGIYALYVMFFPQLVAGPIERPQNLLPQLRQLKIFDYYQVIDGLKLIIWGLFKKVVIADRLAILVNTVYNNFDYYSGLQFLIATICFAFQIYCDFSGYSDIALGTAQTMGFRLMQNFQRPYFARSITDFWRRWHISLSSWFRDYVYIPLGGNRVGKLRSGLNVLVTFLASGLWHGANWTFVVWGLLHGFFIVFSRWTMKLREKLVNKVKLNKYPSLYHMEQVIVTFLLVCFSWIFFRAENLNQALQIIYKICLSLTQVIKALFTGNANFFSDQFTGSEFGLSKSGLIVAFLSILFLVCVQLVQRHGDLRGIMRDRPAQQRWALYYLVIIAIALFGVFDEVPFIYFQF